MYSLEELDKFNLPPLPDLNNLQIDYDQEEFLHIGHIKAIVESLGKICLFVEVTGLCQYYKFEKDLLF